MSTPRDAAARCRARRLAVLLAGTALATSACGGARAPATRPAASRAEGSCVLSSVLDPDEHPHADLIAYRPLTRADFLASAPPRSTRATRGLAAAACSYLVPDPFRIRATPVRRDDGRLGYQARPARVHFHGAVDRRCSWWSDTGPVPPASRLQHEQIHFALTELEARRLNTREDEWQRLATGRGPTADAAIAESRRHLEPILAWGASRLRARQERFDAETALGRDAAAQARWWQQVSRELAETQRLGAADGSAPAPR